MAERRATNKYIPPDFDPKKHGSVNGYRNSHPLRERASKLKTQGILVIRFEMPYNIWCGTCGAHIGMGVRYNAQKKKVGKYLSTPIWSFGMKCHLCSGWIEIHTDPKNAEYVIHSGARRKIESYDPEEAGVIPLASAEDSLKLSTDPIHKLEHDLLDNKKAEDARPVLTQLQEAQERTWSDPYTLNRVIRAKHREERNKIKLEQKESDEVADRLGLAIKVLPESEQDAEMARRIIAQRDRQREMEGKEGGHGLLEVVVDDSEAVARNADKSLLQERKKRKVDGAVMSGLLGSGAGMSAKDELAGKLRKQRVGDVFGEGGSTVKTLDVPVVVAGNKKNGGTRGSKMGGLVAYNSDSDSDN